ncbi:fatty acyl-CoA reductase wat-like isoform X3 [Vespa mandarinia]|uniref:fatty acyl-CoA reductase wat-like isoform X3 n=1 Tax=Vespa mandarinia TaxID=7446 RepID=UPI0016137C38|nr:fatty acyl-CoA reductase wat-like isoform X3 [Vespa mandarinia]
MFLNAWMNLWKIRLLRICPNTYVYTKSAAEDMIQKHAKSISIGFFRPAIVTSTYREPFPGWIDNINGPVGITASVFMGLMRTHYCDGSLKIDLVPGDLTINDLIASAWNISNKHRDDIPIYNYISEDNVITYNRLKKILFKYGQLMPFKEAIWYCSLNITKYRPVYLFYVYFLYLLLLAFIIDTIALCLYKRPRLLRMYNKIHKISDNFGYFSMNEWNLTNERWNELMRNLTPADDELFFCNIKKLD